jgi:hypothetical protein
MIADKIERAPSLLRIPLENIDRWLACGHTAPHRLEQWRTLLLAAQESPEGLQHLLALLRDDREEALHLKSFDPFPGILTREERRQVIAACVYTHLTN